LKGKIDFSQTDIKFPTGLRLAFSPPELEQQFQRQYFARHWNQNRFAISFGLVLFVMFGFVDWLTGGEHWQTILLIRFGIAFPTLLILWKAFRTRKIAERYTPQLVFLSILLFGSAIVAKNVLLPVEIQNLHFAGLLLVMMAGMVFFRSDILWSSAAILITFVLYLTITWAIRPLPVPTVLALSFFLISGFLIMIFASYSLESKERQAFLMEQRLRELAHTDELTGLANRRAFFDHFQSEWRRALRDGSILALLLIDLDHLKQINDTHGHLAGDEALLQLAKVLAEHAGRPGDMAARLGGDEFVLLQHGAEPDRVRKLASRLATRFAVLRLPDSGEEIPLCASIGLVTAVATPSLTPDFLLKRADEALYEAKRSGRACLVHKHLEKPADLQARVV